MNEFETYQTYLAIKQHFDHESYDASKYNFKIKSSVDSYNRRRDRFQFQRLAKKKDPKGFLIANFLENEKLWIGDLFTEEADSVYTEWLKRQESLTYIFTREINQLEENFVDYFKVRNGQHPELLKLYRQKKVSVETLTLLNKFLTFFKVWDNKIQDTIIWPKIRHKCLKYHPLINYDRQKIKKIITDVVNSSCEHINRTEG